MSQAALLPIVLLLISNAMADIMLQPGYEKKQSRLETQPKHQQPIVQPPETLPRAGLENTLDPGYHLELYPVYTDAYHIPADVVSPFLPAGVPASSYNQYLPLPAQNRYKRSIESDEYTASSQRDKRDKDDETAKSSLDDTTLPVVDLPDQKEEKRVNTRQSSDTLLGLNPSNMYPVQQRWVYPQYNAISDPRANPITYKASSIEDPALQKEYQVPMTGNHVDVDNDSEMVGTKHKKVKLVQHVHHHTVLEGPPPNEIPVSNHDSPMDLPMKQVEEPQIAPVYQVPNVPEVKYVPAIHYIVVPPTYGASYVGNQCCGYQAPLVYSPYYVQNVEPLSPVIYQVI